MGIATFEHWIVWREKCALKLCPAEAQKALQGFARARFRKYASAYARRTNVPDPDALTPEPAEAWHWFETHLQLRNTRQGKAYKEWLFSRAGAEDATLDSIQSGATLLMRDVVRECLRREFSPRGMVALEAPAGTPGDDFVPSLRDLLPGPLNTADCVERREIEALAAAEAAGAFAALNYRERVALLARERGLSLAHPAVTATAGCGKSVLATAYHDALQSLAGYVRSKYGQDDRSTQSCLTVGVFEEVRKRVLAWGRSEKACARLSSICIGEGL